MATDAELIRDTQGPWREAALRNPSTTLRQIDSVN